MEKMPYRPVSPLRWYELSAIPLLRPSRAQLGRVAQHPNATVTRGVLWSAMAGIVLWFIGPQRPLLYGWAATYLGLEAASRLVLVGALVAMVLAPGLLLTASAASHVLARVVGGRGCYRALVFSWGVVPLPFIALALLISFIPALVPVPSPMRFSPLFVATQFGSLILLAALNLYLTYVLIVTYAAAEEIGAWKAFGILVLEAVLAGAALACLSATASGGFMNLLFT